ncbi:MAG TPA: hypothetical protein VJ603_02925 [Paucimonas sp.]|nr:hypothetical protein [Paucimonas sp.]
MSETNVMLTDKSDSRRPAISLPQPVWLILLALAIGLSGGLTAPALIKTFGANYGRALGDFALILIPSFILAACLSRQALGGAPRIASTIAPVTAAVMVCPDTSYAALSAVAQGRKLSVAFGSYAGYRLLFPAGPLIVATGLGIDSSGLFFLGLALLIPVWLAGEIWARYRALPAADGSAPANRTNSRWSGDMTYALFPLVVLGGLLLIGAVFSFAAIPALDFITRPKGALLIAAGIAIAATAPEQRRECLDAAMARSASLLLIIGAASAFGAMLTQALPVQRMIPDSATGAGMLTALFMVTTVIKMVHGSSTVTLATAVAVLAPVIHATGVPPAAAVFAICLGSFVILPTDSFYWLVRSDALRELKEGAAIVTLAAGATLQGVVGFLALLLMHLLGFV